MADGGLIAIKIVFIVLIFVMAFVSGILPTIIPWCKKSADVLGIANAFSGGVFLAIAFLHILPETIHEFDEFMEDHDHSEYHVDWLRHGDEEENFPLPFALAFVGYAFILLIDKVIFDTHSLMGDHGHAHGHSHGGSPEQHLLPEGRKHRKEDYQKLLSDASGCND
mmetsp:Transcript_217/g.203  ORF Transcript_217/g.203 Transcript_217/m.203 type:complete len:166 (-) Transcript_217:718-1215(-)|eukprot:CAMPEP_0197011022 /NCGR_PEP_ID=MMETSP1380-20130617/56778_1 /TAXON_ID=5936 /ORGANISM="Euplotes crassus, Strain CT5" /LENGTH=165 /DNA_ID=CAMNT_0042433377 /DNA_START=14 /DNA_END=511 /DNA_ORIENTATION=-